MLKYIVHIQLFLHNVTEKGGKHMAQSNKWVDEMDSQVRRFLQEGCEAAPGHQVHSRTVYQGYSLWCRTRRELAVQAVFFHGWMERMGYFRQRIDRRYYYVGLRLKAV